MRLDNIAGHKMTRLGMKAEASVLVPIIKKDGELSVLFEVRSKSVAQPGEICFPGGHIEPDESPKGAAVRECTEELLIAPEQIEIAAELFEMSGPKGKRIYSYAARLLDYEMTWESAEVESVFLLTISELLDMKPKHSTGVMRLVPDKDFPYELVPNGRDYPFYEIDREFYFYETRYGVIWGMTSIILKGFLELIR